MKTLLVLLVLSLAQAAFSQTVTVKSGDHPGFTRLVLELPQATEWTMGRTDEGYELRLPNAGIRYDLSRVFDTIQRNRLAAIWMDPFTGGLRIGIACACHAMPFEFRPGIIVVDLRDGPPPKGSSFELALDGAAAPDLAARPSLRPMPRPRQSQRSPRAAQVPASLPKPEYDWLASPKPARNADAVIAAPPMAITLSERSDIGPLKDALLRQLGRGAAQGIVQMAKPSLSARTTGDPLAIGPRANIHLGEAPGFAVTTKRGPDNLVIKDGADCLPDDRLEVANWGNDLPVSVQISEARANLIGEFDRPDADAVTNAGKLLIHIGFGAEARQLLAQMPVDSPDSAILTSLAKLVDGGSDPDGPFAGMMTCQTSAALWAVLAQPRMVPSDRPRSEAVSRTFSALPAHLRQTLGPDLAARFLDIGDIATAHAIQNAVLRGVTSPSPDIAVMKAGIAIATGNPAHAEAHLEPVLAEAGPATADAMIALVDARLAAGEQVSPETALALAAFVREQAGSDLDPALRRAHILALGSAGDFDQAFAALPAMPEAARDLWTLLARSGSGVAILDHAVLPADARLPKLDRAERRLLAAELIKLGLAEPALVWIGAATEASSDDDRLLSAAAQMMIGDPAAALADLDGLSGTPASDLRAQAYMALGKPADAAGAWAVTGNKEAELRAQGWAQNWDGLAKSDTSVWQSAAALITPDTRGDTLGPSPLGPLALGTSLVADSADARARLAALLVAVPRPVPGE